MSRNQITRWLAVTLVFGIALNELFHAIFDGLDFSTNAEIVGVVFSMSATIEPNSWRAIDSAIASNLGYGLIWLAHAGSGAFSAVGSYFVAFRGQSETEVEEVAKLRVFLVDDHDLFRAGVRAELAGRVDVVGEAADVEGAIAGISNTAPDVVLLDVLLAPLHECADGGGRGVELRDLVAFDHVPEAVFFAGEGVAQGPCARGARILAEDLVQEFPGLHARRGRSLRVLGDAIRELQPA